MKSKEELAEYYIRNEDDLDVALNTIAHRKTFIAGFEAAQEQATDIYTLLPAVLDEIIEYIEDTEQNIDGEWGSCRDLKELIRDKQMPELYDKLIALRNGR